ncbi:hypothetical protein CHS0354_034141 [Potamilus streckersoni]|uniref:DNA polymerase delta subunit 3 n=1 Tax=Potamilus streckersoni TaxID=2493646 RepID=A0AAE0SMH1_9BIVA|nr:hypothetical protein CHS0354_034141 [Potamilus streckersoni]
MAVDDLYLENIDEYINDENKIVTYKWLSLTLKVHVNIAKQMLYTFVKTQRENKEIDHLTVTYFVAGVSKNDTGEMLFKCGVVPEENLSQYKCSLSVITSCHVYSVQKVKLKDSNALYITDYDVMKDNIFEFSKYSSIQNPRAEIRSEDDMELLAMQMEETDSKPERETKTTNRDSAPPSRVAAPKEKPKGAIANMFANAQKIKDAKPERKDAKPELKQENKPSEKTTKPAGKKQGGMMSFFAKQTDKSEKTDHANKEVKKNKESTSSVKEQKTDHDSKEVKKKEESPPKMKEKTTDHTRKEVKKKEELPAKRKELSPPRKTSRKTERVESDDEDSSKKKRRRIKQDLFDSSSEEEEEEVEIEEDSPVPSPVKEPSPIPESPSPEAAVVDEEDEKEEKEEQIITRTSSKERGEKVMTGEKRRVRRKKQVKKTFMDKDGFLVTEKVWESESTDASEVEEPVKKPPVPAKPSSPQKKPSPKKKGSPSKGGGTTQTSLMSFFKKK